MPISDDHRFPRTLRLRKRDDFDRVFERRRSVADDLLIVYGRANERDYPRLGLSVSRKVGNAVVRNRWKRLLREAFRLSRRELPPGLDLVIIPRPGLRPELAALRRSLRKLTPRLLRRLEDR